MKRAGRLAELQLSLCATRSRRAGNRTRVYYRSRRAHRGDRHDHLPLAACPASDSPLPKRRGHHDQLDVDRMGGCLVRRRPAGSCGRRRHDNLQFRWFVDVAGPVFVPGHAFKIDSVGGNTPLVFESIAVDGIFAPGETWIFVIDDYVNTGGLAASLFGSFGVGNSSAGGPSSSGSIIAVRVPEPGTLVLLLVGATILAFRPGVRRWKR